jgi:hypothetical protein
VSTWLTWLIIGGIIFAVMTGVSLGLLTRPPYGRGMLRRAARKT